MTIEIRRLASADAALFVRVAPEVFDEPVDPARVKAYLAEPNHLMVVALADGEVVGQCAAVIHCHPDKPTELYIDEVGVAPAFRRQGIAGQMLDAMMALGKSLGCEEAWVGTELGNEPARRLYRSRQARTEESFVMYEYDL